MAQIALEASDCRIGTKEINLFAAVTFVADYTAHAHLDSNDFAQGAKHEQLEIIIRNRQNMYIVLNQNIS